ncbi:hypothetical protein, no similarity [Maudiozyma saulgeensis]|uniref:Uncharacterized protein n=1 Tax=Maudiozyma saulgeensis TaxID=1789683 RepID=A0A1X7R1Q8_9SACH|nr:hypothetical protein, no similarity [Kazachstania saulgeensis]
MSLYKEISCNEKTYVTDDSLRHCNNFDEFEELHCTLSNILSAQTTASDIAIDNIDTIDCLENNVLSSSNSSFLRLSSSPFVLITNNETVSTPEDNNNNNGFLKRLGCWYQTEKSFFTLHSAVATFTFVSEDSHRSKLMGSNYLSPILETMTSQQMRVLQSLVKSIFPINREITEPMGLKTPRRYKNIPTVLNNI